MGTYLHENKRAFKQMGDPTDLPTKRRSESRLKEYYSATDTRAWVNDELDNKKYFIDLINQEVPKQLQLGKYVPIEVLIDTLLANKNADIEELTRQLRAYEEFIGELNLTPEQLARLDKIKGGGDGEKPKSKMLGTAKAYADTSRPGSSRGKDENDKDYGQEKDSPRPGRRDLQGAPEKVTVQRMEVKDGGMAKGKDGVMSPRRDGRMSQERDGRMSQERDGASSPRTQGRHGAMAPQGKDGTGKDGTKIVEGAVMQGKEGTLLQGRYGAVVQNKDGTMVQVYDAQVQETDAKGSCFEQRELARKAIEQLENIKAIISERDNLKKQLSKSREEVKNLKKCLCQKKACEADIRAMEAEIQRLKTAGKDDEIEVISKELDLLKKYCEKLNNIKEENQRLKEENVQLKNKFNDEVKSLKCDDKDKPNALQAHHSQPVCLCSKATSKPTDAQDDEDTRRYYQDQVAVLNQKIAKLKEISEERDRLQASVTRLQNEMEKFGKLNEEVEVFKNRSLMLDSVISERDSLHKRLEGVKGLEDELKKLRAKADRADELERMLSDLKKVKPTESCDSIRKEAEILRIDRDRMKMRLDECAMMEREFAALKAKLAKLEDIQNERDECRCKVEQMQGMKNEYEFLKGQLDDAKGLEQERNALLRRVRDLECVIADQENEINRLVSHVDRLSKQQELQQDRMKEIVTDLRSEIEVKSSIIEKSEEQIVEIQNDLKDTIREVSAETENLKREIGDAERRIAELERLLREKEKALEDATSELEQARCQMAKTNSSLDKMSTDKDDLMKKMREQLEKLLAENARLQSDNEGFKEGLKQIANSSPDLTDNDKLAIMLQKSSGAVRRATEELDKKLKGETEADCARMRAQKLLETDNCKELQDKYNQLEKELNQLRTDLNEKEAEIKMLRQQSTEIQGVAQDQITDLLNQLKKCQEENVSLKKSLLADDSAAQLEQLKKELAAAKNELAQKGVDDDCLKQLEQLKKELADAKQGGLTNDDLRKQLEQAKRDLAAANKGDEDCKKQLEDLKKQLADSGKSVQPIVDDDCRKELEQLKKELGEARKNGAKNEEDLKKQLEQLKKELGEAKNASQTEEDLRKQLEQLKKELGEAKKAGQAEEDCRKELESLKRQLADLSKPDDDCRKELEKLRNELTNAKSNHDASKNELEQLRKELEQLRKQLAEAQKASQNEEDCRKQLELLKKELADIKKQASSKDDDYKKQLEQLKKELADANRAGLSEDECRKQLEQLKKELAESKKSQAGLDDCKKQLEELKKELAAAYKAAGDAQKEAAEARKAAQPPPPTGNAALDDCRKELENLRQQLAEAKKKALDDQNEINKLRTQLSAVPKDGDDAAERQNLLDMISKLQEQLDAAGAEKQDSGSEKSDTLKDEQARKLRLLEVELTKQKQESIDTIKGLKSQYDRDIKNMQEKYNDGIAKLQTSHEELLALGNKELEREVEELRKQSKQSQITIASLKKSLDNKAPLLSKCVQKMDIAPCPCANLDENRFKNLLCKTLNEGIESLSFDDLQFLHTKICDATSKLVSCGKIPKDCIPSYHQDLDIKQRHRVAQAEVAKLQFEVALERKRLEDLKRSLEVEKQTNSDLAQRIQSQSRTVNNYMTALNEEKSKSKILENDLAKEKDMRKRLSNLLAAPTTDRPKCRCSPRGSSKTRKGNTLN